MGAARLSAWFDGRVIDGVVDGVAYGVRAAGDRVRRAQSSQVRVNILAAVAIVIALLAVCVKALR
jgi:hypothetical protein